MSDEEIHKQAVRIAGMVQGEMALEGQGLTNQRDFDELVQVAEDCIRRKLEKQLKHSDSTKETYAGEKPARICMFTAGGQHWFEDHDKATEVIRRDFPKAVAVRRWQENGLQYEDYKDSDGNVLVQLEFAGPAVLSMGFIYE